MSVTLRNVSGLGDLEIAGVGLVVAGATFEVTDEQAEGLAVQTDNFTVVKPSKSTAAKPADTTTGA